MGMTTYEHIVQLKKLKSFHNGSYGANINFAIDTMRKYEKIEEEISQWHKDGTNWSDLRLMAIERILEDGSENNHHASNT